MAGSSLDCGCILQADPNNAIGIEPCAQHQLDPRGLAQALADAPINEPQAAPAATYSGNPSVSGKDAVRFKLGDTGTFSVTDQTRFYLTDGEINYLMQQAGGQIDTAASQGCYAIMAKAAQMRDESNGSVSISWGQVYNNFASLQKRLASGTGRGSMPFCGGISRSRQAAERANPDRIKPSFTRDMMQVPDDPEEPIDTRLPSPYGGNGYV